VSPQPRGQDAGPDPARHPPLVSPPPVERRGAIATPARRQPARPVAFWFGVGLAILHIWFNTLGTLSELWTSVIHFAGFGFLCALLYPAMAGAHRGGPRVVLAIDVLLGLAALSLFAYLYAGRGCRLLPPRPDHGLCLAGLGVHRLALFLGIEFTRRTTGWIIPILIILAFTYITFWGRYVGGMLTFSGLRTDTMLFRIFYTDDGMFGTVARISSSFVFMFILFGAFLLRSGAGRSSSTSRRFWRAASIGGPGLVAVIGSG
jgi:TRAP-type uncharacterized transport system fused permease subunit